MLTRCIVKRLLAGRRCAVLPVASETRRRPPKVDHVAIQGCPQPQVEPEIRLPLFRHVELPVQHHDLAEAEPDRFGKVARLEHRHPLGAPRFLDDLLRERLHVLHPVGLVGAERPSVGEHGVDTESAGAGGRRHAAD